MKMKVEDFITCTLDSYFNILRTREDCPRCVKQYATISAVGEVCRKENDFVLYPFKQFSSSVKGKRLVELPKYFYYLVMPVMDYEVCELRYDFFGFKSDADLKYFMENVYKILGYCTSNIALFKLSGKGYKMVECPYDPDQMLSEQLRSKRKRK